jgi:hypothetical protein
MQQIEELFLRRGYQEASPSSGVAVKVENEGEKRNYRAGEKT